LENSHEGYENAKMTNYSVVILELRQLKTLKASLLLSLNLE